MTYFLDFDRTLIDYEKYLAYLVTLPEWAQFHARLGAYMRGPDGTNNVTPEERTALFTDIDAWYAAGGYTFAAGELEHLLFDDVHTFLTAHGESSIIITAGSGSLVYQRDRVTSTGLHTKVKDIVYMSEADGHKGRVVAGLALTNSEPFVFVDDKDSQLDDVQRLAPNVLLFHMARDYATTPSARHSVITRLAELP